MNITLEEILIVIIAFLIGWFLRTMIGSTNNNKNTNVKLTTGKHARNVDGKPHDWICDNYDSGTCSSEGKTKFSDRYCIDNSAFNYTTMSPEPVCSDVTSRHECDTAANLEWCKQDPPTPTPTPTPTPPSPTPSPTPTPTPTPSPPSPNGGCQGTRYDCCPDGYTPKNNNNGTNCPDYIPPNPRCNKILNDLCGETKDSDCNECIKTLKKNIPGKLHTHCTRNQITNYCSERNPMPGGCQGTRYNCCPDGYTPKNNKRGTNCHGKKPYPHKHHPDRTHH